MNNDLKAFKNIRSYISWCELESIELSLPKVLLNCCYGFNAISVIQLLWFHAFDNYL